MKDDKRVQEFGSRLRTAIKARGFDKDEAFANEAHIGRTALSNYINEVSAPPLGMLIKFAKILDVSTDYLLGLSDASLNAPLNAHLITQDKINRVSNQVHLIDQDTIKDRLKESVLEAVRAAEEEKPDAQFSIDDKVYFLSTKSFQASTALTKPAPIVVTLNSRGQENIAMVDTKAAAGYPVHYLEPEFYHELPVFSLPGHAFRNATFRCFQVRGNSMVPTFHHEDWVISRYVDNWPQNIKNGYVYVVVTTEQVFIKRVLNRVMERNTLVLQSDNEEYDTQEVNALDVLELWYVKARLSFKFPNTRFEVHRKVGEMQADIQYLLNEVKALKTGSKKAD